MTFCTTTAGPNCSDETKEQVLGLGGLLFELSRTSVSLELQDTTLKSVLPYAMEDILAYHDRDPSVRHKPISCLISPYATFFSVLAHRIAHRLIFSCEGNVEVVRDALHISYCARSNTGIEIHPESQIGRRFVIDHGWGTVIGQTVAIGDDCYVLNNVTLGGRAVANAPDGKRHPTLHNRIQVCAGAKIFGPISVADDCFIGPDTTITIDLPTGTTILGQQDLTDSCGASLAHKPNE